MTDHIPRRSLERLFAQELPSGQARQLESHSRGCSDCQRILTELERSRDLLLTRLPPARFAASVEARGPRLPEWVSRLWAPGVLTLAATAAIALVFLHAPDVRLKGTGLSVYRKHAGQVTLLAGVDSAIHAGDGLKVQVVLASDSLVQAWFISAGGHMTPLLGAPARFARGVQVLPGSVQVESPCEDLWLVVGTGTAVGVETEAAVQKAFSHGTPAGDATWLPRGGLGMRLRCG